MAQPKSAVAVAAANVVNEKRGTGTVTVACKVGPGLQLQLTKPTKYFEDTPSGTRERIRYDRIGKRVFIKGPTRPVNPAPGTPEAPPMAGGYALTHDVPRDFWEEWEKQNQGSPLLENRLIYATTSHGDAVAKGREQESVRTGLEPLKVDGTDPRVPKPRRSAIGEVGAVTTADVQTL